MDARLGMGVQSRHRQRTDHLTQVHDLHDPRDQGEAGPGRQQTRRISPGQSFRPFPMVGLDEPGATFRALEVQRRLSHGVERRAGILRRATIRRRAFVRPRCQSGLGPGPSLPSSTAIAVAAARARARARTSRREQSHRRRHPRRH